MGRKASSSKLGSNEGFDGELLGTDIDAGARVNRVALSNTGASVGLSGEGAKDCVRHLYFKAKAPVETVFLPGSTMAWKVKPGKQNSFGY
jgi:hypothetical protein